MYPWLNPLFAQLSSRYARNSLHHALLFKGIGGLGKAEFARQFARFLLCSNKQGDVACGVCQACKLNKVDSHPDLHQIETEKQVGIDAVREALQKLIGTAHLSGAKVLIIHGADRMTESAANALLKTLEEPTDNTYLMLVCDRADGLLPTILSRCEKLSFPVPSVEVCQSWLKENGHPEIEHDFIRLYGNAPLKIRQELASEKRLDYKDFIQALKKLRSKQTSATELATNWKDKEIQVISWIRQLSLTQIRLSPSQDILWDIHNSAIEASKTVQQTGINKSLLLAGLLSKTTDFQF